MSSVEDRTKLYGAILSLIEEARTATGDEALGCEVEEAILDTQFRELESEILENPGAFEPWLVRRRHIN
ncbi:MAG: hypothetical protein KGN36_01880 [Acidobacteriota bacterium]|nr:hypothetical protein [Acidobacteriota bacterium]